MRLEVEKDRGRVQKEMGETEEGGAVEELEGKVRCII